MQQDYQRGDLVMVESMRTRSLFLIYSVYDDCVKLVDNKSNLYPKGRNLFIKKDSLILLNRQEPDDGTANDIVD